MFNNGAKGIYNLSGSFANGAISQFKLISRSAVARWV